MPHHLLSRLALPSAALAMALGLGGCQLMPRAARWAHFLPHLPHARTFLATAPTGAPLPSPRQWAHLGRPAMPAAKAVPADAPPRTAQTIDDALYARATEAIRNRNYALALEVLQVSRQRRPNDARVLTATGVVYDKLGRFDLSGRYYQLAEAADPGSKIVAADQAYSAVLQRMAQTGRGPIVDAPHAAPAQLASLAAAPLFTASPVPEPLQIGHPIELRNASGDAAASGLVRASLIRKGWRVSPGASEAVSNATVLRFPAQATRMATGLAATLEIPVRLEPCSDCDRIELVLGRNAVGPLNLIRQGARG